MLITLGFSMIAVFMYLILSKRLTPMVALILVPLTFAVLAGAFGITGEAEEGVVDSIMTAIGDFAPTAVLLFFAIIYFGLMIDVGLFDPLIRFILRVVGNDPVRLVVCTAVLAGIVSLDGDGSTTFIITVSALLPIYLQAGHEPGGAHRGGQPGQRRAEHRPVGRPDGPGRDRAEGVAVRAVQPDGAGHDRSAWSP